MLFVGMKPNVYRDKVGIQNYKTVIYRYKIRMQIGKGTEQMPSETQKDINNEEL